MMWNEVRARRLGLLVAVLTATSTVAATAAVMENASGPALVIGPDGLGLFAYYDRANGDLKVAHCVDAACSAITTVTVDSAGDVGRKVSMAMLPAGPVIAYEDTTNTALKLALCADPLCSAAATMTIDSNLVGANTAVARASDGRPLLAYVADEGGFSYRLKAAHCEDALCTTRTISVLEDAASADVGLVVGGDGRGLIWYYGFTPVPAPGSLLRCSDVACTSGSGARDSVSAPAREPLVGAGVDYPSMRVGADGFPRIAFSYGIFSDTSVRTVRCADPSCFGTASLQAIPAAYEPSAMALGTDDCPRVVLAAKQPTAELQLVRCLDAGCAAYQPPSCVAGAAHNPSLALDASDIPLVAFERGDNVEVLRPPVACTPQMEVPDEVTLTERTPPNAALELAIRVGFSPAATSPVQVSYQTVDGTAQAGVDYLPVSGTLTFAPGQPLYQDVMVPIVPDAVAEPDETFQLVLSAPVNVTIANGTATVVIRNDDAPEIAAGACTRVEGNSGTQGCVIPVTLNVPSTQAVIVDYATASGTATQGVDYTAAAGTLTFYPGATSTAVPVSVVGDTAVELDENFSFFLSNPVNATLGSGGDGLIVDDDALPLSSLELTHGARVNADLAAGPGPTPSPDLYRLAQGPFTSWEIVVDEVSGDVAPGLLLELLAEDNATVVHTGFAVGTGAARSLRWQYPGPLNEVRRHIRVSSTSCTTDCDADDRYRLRAWETTGLISRFNNAGSQVTVLVLQNASAEHVTATAAFWRADGSMADFLTFPLGPYWNATLNTATVPTLAGLSGSITVSHNGPYGALAGKAVALEPSTGFSFDSPMTSKPR